MKRKIFISEMYEYIYFAWYQQVFAQEGQMIWAVRRGTSGAEVISAIVIKTYAIVNSLKRKVRHTPKSEEGGKSRRVEGYSNI